MTLTNLSIENNELTTVILHGLALTRVERQGNLRNISLHHLSTAKIVTNGVAGRLEALIGGRKEGLNIDGTNLIAHFQYDQRWTYIAPFQGDRLHCLHD